jgi:hypothetical protein
MTSNSANNYALDAQIRANKLLKGKEAYEASLHACPFYMGSHIKRRPWDDLTPVEQWSWTKDPYPAHAPPTTPPKGSANT